MALADEYRQYAREYLESAAQAGSEHDRKQFLNMARAWTQAALRLEGAGAPGQIIPIGWYLCAGIDALGSGRLPTPQRFPPCREEGEDASALAVERTTKRTFFFRGNPL